MESDTVSPESEQSLSNHQDEVTVDFDVCLSCQYLNGIVTDAHKYIGLDKWKLILGVKKDIDLKWFKRCIKDTF